MGTVAHAQGGLLGGGGAILVAVGAHAHHGAVHLAHLIAVGEASSGEQIAQSGHFLGGGGAVLIQESAPDGGDAADVARGLLKQRLKD